jgi:hypothetical protein
VKAHLLLGFLLLAGPVHAGELCGRLQDFAAAAGALAQVPGESETYEARDAMYARGRALVDEMTEALRSEAFARAPEVSEKIAMRLARVSSTMSRTDDRNPRTAMRFIAWAFSLARDELDAALRERCPAVKTP